MRRKDRELKDSEKIKTFIQSCSCCRIAFPDDNGPYIVPLNFGYEETGGKHFFYFHSASEGRKIDLIKRGGNVGFELDSGCEIYGNGDDACSYSARFRSVTGTGRISFVLDREKKLEALKNIMRHYAGEKNWSFKDETVNSVCVFRMEALTLSCKEHL